MSASNFGGQGSFHGNVSGHCVIDDITNGDTPSSGSITGSAPKPE